MHLLEMFGVFMHVGSVATCNPAEPLWTDFGIKSGISVHEPIATSTPPQKKPQKQQPQPKKQQHLRTHGINV